MRCLQLIVVALLLIGGALPSGEGTAAASPTVYLLQGGGARPQERTPPALVLLALAAAFVGLRFSRPSTARFSRGFDPGVKVNADSRGAVSGTIRARDRSTRSTPLVSSANPV